MCRDVEIVGKISTIFDRPVAKVWGLGLGLGFVVVNYFSYYAL